MNIEFNEQHAFETIISLLCTKAEDNIYPIKKKLGAGNIVLKELSKSVSMMYFDIELTQPIVAKWNFKSEDKNQYFFISNLSEKSDDILKSDLETIEEGAVFFTQNSVRRKLWLPNVHYTAIVIVFNDEWLKRTNFLFPLDEEVSLFINKAQSVYLNAGISTYSRLTLKQVLELKDKGKEMNSFIELKILELVFLFFESVFSMVSTSKKNLAVHPDDLSKMNSFVNSLNNKLEKLPTLVEASRTLVMSESKFQRLFKKIFRKTYYSYILEIRMNFALELLMGKMSVSQVALETGYSSISNFTIAFKRHFKYLPSEV